MEKYGAKNSSPKVDGKRAAKENDSAKLIIYIKLSEDKIHIYRTENISLKYFIYSPILPSIFIIRGVA